MDRAKLSRREVLAGLAVTGSSGALVGSGTGALFSDDETFTNNAIEASESTAGVVDLEVTPDTTGTFDQKGETIEFEVSLPMEDGRRENPAFVCVNTKKGECPTDYEEMGGSPTSGGIDPDDLRVRLKWVDCKEDTRPIIDSASLREVLDVLTQGILLPCNSTPCLEPGDTVTLIFELLDILPAEKESDSTDFDFSFDFELEFDAEQCRYNDFADMPTLSDLLEPCDGINEECTPRGGKAISFIAFCSSSSEPLNPSIEVKLTDGDDDITSVMWETDAPVDYVVMFGGQNWTLYNYRDEVPKPKSGVATTGGNTDYDAFYETEGQGSDKMLGTELLKDDLDNDTDCEPQSCPCEVAEDILNDSDTFNGQSVKLKEQNGTFMEAP